jgi:hypothetical protein
MLARSDRVFLFHIFLHRTFFGVALSSRGDNEVDPAKLYDLSFSSGALPDYKPPSMIHPTIEHSTEAWCVDFQPTSYNTPG